MKAGWDYPEEMDEEPEEDQEPDYEHEQLMKQEYRAREP